jgi:hypothetical protein
MLATIAQVVLPAVAVFTTLFAVLVRRNPKPSGVALFLRVGLAGLALSLGLFYLVTKTGAFSPDAARVLTNVYRGIGMGGGILVVMAAIGVMLKRER